MGAGAEGGGMLSAAARSVPCNATGGATKAQRAGAGDIALGDRLLHQGDAARKLPTCSDCHGSALTGMEPSIPGLLGLHPPCVNAQLGAWKNNNRVAMAPACMHAVAQKLTPANGLHMRLPRL